MSHTQFVILCVNVYFFKVCFPHQFCQKGSGQLTFVGTESHVRRLLDWKVVNQSFQGLLTQVKNLGAGRVGLEHYWKLLSRKETYSKQPFENTDLRTDSVLSVLHQRESRGRPHHTRPARSRLQQWTQEGLKASTEVVEVRPERRVRSRGTAVETFTGTRQSEIILSVHAI